MTTVTPCLQTISTPSCIIINNKVYMPITTRTLRITLPAIVGIYTVNNTFISDKFGVCDIKKVNSFDIIELVFHNIEWLKHVKSMLSRGYELDGFRLDSESLYIRGWCVDENSILRTDNISDYEYAI